MEFETQDDSKNIQIYEHMEKLKKKNSLLLLYDVDNSLTANELEVNIREQNLKDMFHIMEINVIMS